MIIEKGSYVQARYKCNIRCKGCTGMALSDDVLPMVGFLVVVTSLLGCRRARSNDTYNRAGECSEMAHCSATPQQSSLDSHAF